MPRRVLIVDDDRLTRRVLGSMLEQAGFLMVYAADGEEGWREVQRQTIDLVITDRSMPNLDGVQLVHRIRASAQFASLPVIMLSATPCGAGNDAADERVNAILMKGLAATDLWAAVARVLDGTRATTAAR